MQQLFCALALVAVTAGPALAQSATVKQETKIEVKDGKDVTLTGCLEAHPDATAATQYQLTDVAGTGGRGHSYLLVGERDDLQKYVGQLIEVKGKAADAEDGKVKVKTKTTVDRENAPDRKSESTSEMKGDLAGLPLLGVKHVRAIRPTCQ
jgi:hypothetical protein